MANWNSIMSPSECISWITVFITESLAIVTLNILTIIVFMKNRSLRKRSMYLVINLAVADMLVGGFSAVVLLVRMGIWSCNVWKFKVSYLEIWYDIIDSGLGLFSAASLTNLAAISLERMYATFRPFAHRVVKSWVLGVVITVTWVTAGLLLTVMVTVRKKSYIGMLYAWCSSISICLFIIFVSYTSILVKVYCGAHPQHHGATSRERTLTKTLFMVTLVSLITWLPYLVYIFLIINADISLPLLVIWRLDNSFIFLHFANSLVNPIMYAIRMPEFRRALVSLFRRQNRHAHAQIPLPVIPGN